MKVSDNLKMSLDKQKRSIRMSAGQGDDPDKIIEIRPIHFSRFILSISRIILEILYSKYPTEDKETYKSWMKILSGEDEKESNDIARILYSFITYYLEMDTDSFEDTDEEWKGFTSPKNTASAWAKYQIMQRQKREEEILAERQLRESQEEDALSPIYDSKSNIPHCPKCNFRLAEILPMDPWIGHITDLVWMDQQGEPIYRFCPKCGQNIDWKTPIKNLKKRKSFSLGVSIMKKEPN